MFYVANVITFSVFMEILQKSTLLISYKLNILQIPWVNQLMVVHCNLAIMPDPYLQIKWSYMESALYHVFYLTLYIYLCLLLTYLSEGVIFLHYELFQVHTIIGDSSPPLNPIQGGKKHASLDHRNCDIDELPEGRFHIRQFDLKVWIWHNRQITVHNHQLVHPWNLEYI